MRISRLRFKNLNSLAGEWDIDFTDAAYVSSGIFAITGPTGAGKTTILDALCLALYGQTPRLGKITQSANEIMSRQTGECFAEVEFETAKGSFRSNWAQHRSRKKADGALQSPKHEIAEKDSGQILESKLKAVGEKVEEVTGMDFDRFTRSMLLAQGGFAAFLQARPDERAPILEQITGTEIYSRISMKVHERTSEQRKKLEAMNSELGGMQALSPEEEESLRLEEAEGKGRENEISAEALRLREALAWRERIATLETELAELDLSWRSFEEKKKSAAPDFEKLARARQAMVFEGAYAGIMAVRRQKEAEEGELAEASGRLPLAEEGRQAALERLEKAEGTLKKASSEQEREAELIRRTRELDIKLDGAASELLGLQAESEKLGVQAGDLQGAIKSCEDRIAETSAVQAQAEAFLAEHRSDAGLAEALGGIEQRIKALGALHRQRCDLKEKSERQRTAILAAAETLERTEKGWRETDMEVAEAGKRLETRRAEFEALLQGRELSSWREEAESLTGRQARLTALGEIAARIGETERKLEELKTRRESFERDRMELLRQEEALVTECELREKAGRQLQEKALLLGRVRDLEEERARLVDGAPCPLCGSPDHPYAGGNVPTPDEAEKELEQARTEYRKTSENLSKVRAEGAGVAKELEQADKERGEWLTLLDRDRVSCSAGFTELDLIAGEGELLDVIGAQSETCRESSMRCRALIREAEEREKEERLKKTALDRLREELTLCDKARQAASLGHQSALSEGRRLEGELASLNAELDQALAETERALEPYGCRVIAPENAPELLDLLIGRRAAYGEALTKKEELEKGLNEVGREKELQQVRLTETEKSLSESRRILAEKTALRDELTALRLELYGERNPDEEEKRLAEALKKAGESRELALSERGRLESEHAGLVERIAKLTASIAARENELSGEVPTFLARLAEANFEGEAAFLEARLPQAEVIELGGKADKLQSEETEILTRREDRTASLLREREKELTEKAVEAIREESADVAARLAELQQSLGAIGQRLRHHADQLRLQQDRVKEIDKQKKECGRWDRLHELIGSADGKKFRNFAQGLTFELMVSHANRQLQKMSDRYILVRDEEQPLELNVFDNYQAGEIRSTKNLSGGESFIVSLALALGLSKMASRNVRVDSLFLDEGFGTLDEDALETALETLSALQQDGKLIGIISHVAALKERIGTQIKVEAGNGGRSILDGPGCGRIV